ncbi:MAG: hypothetical protein LBD63_01280, partial [Mycoplasmataceae bacterium]|nr:hypothetical protein [Mycoplasmataceae bacterium]
VSKQGDLPLFVDLTPNAGTNSIHSANDFCSDIAKVVKNDLIKISPLRHGVVIIEQLFIYLPAIS